MPWKDVLLQVGMALLYYAVLLAILRLAGKRLAGQTTALDLVVLIALASARSRFVRELVRGRPVVLIEDGRIDRHRLEREGLSLADLHAGLRKLGYEDPKEIKTAVLEETGPDIGDPDRATLRLWGPGVAT
jgi:uncharacterized membrane protein YcaP (DUF421 family)